MQAPHEVLLGCAVLHRRWGIPVIVVKSIHLDSHPSELLLLCSVYDKVQGVYSAPASLAQISLPPGLKRRYARCNLPYSCSLLSMRPSIAPDFGEPEWGARGGDGGCRLSPADRQSALHCWYPRIEGMFYGTGDTFSALFLGHYDGPHPREAVPPSDVLQRVLAKTVRAAATRTRVGTHLGTRHRSLPRASRTPHSWHRATH